MGRGRGISRDGVFFLYSRIGSKRNLKEKSFVEGIPFSSQEFLRDGVMADRLGSYELVRVY